MNEIDQRLKKALKWCRERELECKKDPTKRDLWYSKKARQKKRQQSKEYQRRKRRFDERFRLSAIMSSRMRNSLKKKSKGGKHWETLVGYNLEKLQRRLKRAMPKGYTWQDFLDGKLHIDHIIPVVAFNFSSPEHLDFRRCWSLKNLRLLPKKENLRKGNKLKKIFQPYLKI